MFVLILQLIPLQWNYSFQALIIDLVFHSYTLFFLLLSEQPALNRVCGTMQQPTCVNAPRVCQSPRGRPIAGHVQPVTPPRRIIEVSLVSPAEPARSVVRSAEGLNTQRRDHVFQEPERVCDPVFVDYGVNEPGKCVREEAGRLFLHCQYLPSKMRLEMPQPAHHSHLRFLQALSGTSTRPQAPKLLAVCWKIRHERISIALFNEWICASRPFPHKSNLFLLSPIVSRQEQVTNGAEILSLLRLLSGIITDMDVRPF